MTDFMDMLKPTIEAINDSASSAYREGFKAGYREAQLELKKRVRTVSTDLDGIDYACAVLQIVREFIP